MNTIVGASVAALLIFAFSFTPNLAAGKEIAFNLTEIAAGNYVHQGHHMALDAPGYDDIANIGFIIGERCVAVIDTGGSVTTGQQLLGAIRTITDKPICYVVNTHVHYDHLLGNPAFAASGTTFIGHIQLAQAVEANREFFLKEFADALGESPTLESIIGPGQTVTTSQTLDLGGKTLLLTAYPPSHTHADLTVLDQTTNTLWTGDLVFRERIPVIDGSLKGWITVMDELKKIPAAIIIPGHGAPGNSWAEVLMAQENYLNSLLNETRQAIADGLFIEEALDTVGAGEKEKWLLFDLQHRTNVSRAFVELEWE